MKIQVLIFLVGIIMSQASKDLNDLKDLQNKAISDATNKINDVNKQNKEKYINEFKKEIEKFNGLENEKSYDIKDNNGKVVGQIISNNTCKVKLPKLPEELPPPVKKCIEFTDSAKSFVKFIVDKKNDMVNVSPSEIITHLRECKIIHVKETSIDIMAKNCYKKAIHKYTDKIFNDFHEELKKKGYKLVDGKWKKVYSVETTKLGNNVIKNSGGKTSSGGTTSSGGATSAGGATSQGATPAKAAATNKQGGGAVFG